MARTRFGQNLDRPGNLFLLCVWRFSGIPRACPGEVHARRYPGVRCPGLVPGRFTLAATQAEKNNRRSFPRLVAAHVNLYGTRPWPPAQENYLPEEFPNERLLPCRWVFFLTFFVSVAPFCGNLDDKQAFSSEVRKR